MRQYDALFIFPVQEGPEAVKDELKKIEEAVSRFGGRTLDRQDWGQRLLGYPVRKSREGRLLLWNFEMESPRLAELRKVLELDEKILKVSIFKTVRPKPVSESGEKHKEAARARQS